MTRYFVRPSGGSDSNSGLSYALAFATGNKFETVAAPGDELRITPGTYRQTFTTAVSGTNGNPISYVADVFGTLTDGIGGRVRITASDNDQTAVRGSCIITTHNYRTFTGLYLDSATSQDILISGSNNVIVQDCNVMHCNLGISIVGATQANCTVRRCVVMGTANQGIFSQHTVTVNNVGHIIENCKLMACQNQAVRADRVGGITVRNCTFIGGSNAVRVAFALAVGQTITVNNCIIFAETVAFQATAVGEITEDFNNLHRNSTDYSNVTAGANTKSYPPLLNAPLLNAPYTPTWLFGMLSSESLLASIAGSGVASDDFYGATRASPSSWGADQFIAGLRPSDAGRTRSSKQ